jgi:hypothetical protein
MKTTGNSLSHFPFTSGKDKANRSRNKFWLCSEGKDAFYPVQSQTLEFGKEWGEVETAPAWHNSLFNPSPTPWRYSLGPALLGRQ